MENINFINLIEEVEIQTTPVYDGEVSTLIRDLLLALGENPERDGLQRTPERVSRMFDELLSGYRTDLDEVVNGAIFESDYQDVVLVRDIEFYSLCEHHMLPFFGKAHVAYVPNGKIIGLSKIPRLVEMFARRLQVQERMTQQIAEAVHSILQPKGVAIVVEGAHMCAMMRGIKKSDTNMLTQTMLGDYQTDEKLRQEFIYHLQRRVKD